MQSMSFASREVLRSKTFSSSQWCVYCNVNKIFVLDTEVMSLKIRPLQVPTKMKFDGYVTIDFSFENQERLSDQIDILS